MREPDAAFADPRQAVLYDALDDDRSDLDVYLAIVEEVGGDRVIDIGCGTGTLAVLLAAMGRTVIGVDPADASLDVARAKPNADRVTWVHGDATSLVGRNGVGGPVVDGTLDHAGLLADVAVMTGNVAQVFVSDDDWSRTLAAVHACLRPGGCFVFETRRPEARAWESWDLAPTAITLPDGRCAVVERTVTEVALPLITFEGSTTIDGEALRSRSTLRFRERDEIERDLAVHGFTVVDVREAPDRPGKEHVFLARCDGVRPVPRPGA
ncbi:class I SAM-dependent methyltransferase [Nocardioides jensenii]|uniref:class I SAM-dependent methyltransferase n=1 Tax=Nocardioides jensenii TaxID=1843 RepID=UPI0008339BF9|nr:class I SAM-dependent methyltransferase [Nocardioides jensenii]